MSAVTFFKALADETRLRILNLVLFREFNVNELVNILNMGQSRISRHLKILTDSGLLAARRDGLWVFYRTENEDRAKKFIDSISFLFLVNEKCKDDLVRAGEVLKTGRQEAKRFFDELSSDWEALKRGMIGKLDLGAEIAERLQECNIAVDLGCGTGDLLPALLKKANTVIGVDSSPRMLEKARRRFAGNGEKIQLRIGELEHLPLSNEEADCALIILVLHHLPSPVAGILEARRVLGNKGRLIVVDFTKHRDESMRSRYGDRWLGFSRAEMEDWLKEADFKIDENVEFPIKGNLTIALYLATKV